MSTGASYHAIYVVLNDSEFFPASLRSVYPHISGATVVTAYDRDRWGAPVEANSPIGRILSRELDPERKVNVLACTEVSEARLRNRAMALVYPPRKVRDVISEDARLARLVDPDFFWIVDADEIYDDDNVDRLKEYVRTHSGNSYMVQAYSYWRSWNWRIQEAYYYTAVMKPGAWFGHLRFQYTTPWVRLLRKLVHERVLSQRVAYRAFGARLVPRHVATFHHGNYIGDRARIEAKLGSSGHRRESDDRWLREVWDQWTPETRNFHPHTPESFPSAEHVPTSDLPATITSHDWPTGWIERDGPARPDIVPNLIL